MTNVIDFRPRSKPPRRPSFGQMAHALIAMEAALTSLDPHGDTIAVLSRQFTDLINIGRPDPKALATANLFVSAHMFLEDLKAWQAANKPAEAKQ